MLDHDWLKTSREKMRKVRLPVKELIIMLKNIKNYKKRDVFQSGICSALAHFRGEDYERNQIGKMFKKWDKDFNGTLNIEEFKEGI